MSESTERYGKIALTGNSDCCCMPGEYCSNADNGHPSTIESAKLIGYDAEDIDSIPKASVLGVGCGAPTKLAKRKSPGRNLQLSDVPFAFMYS